MKKSLKIILCAVLCIALSIISVSAALTPGDGNTVRVDTGTCNEQGMLTWKLSSETYDGNTENILIVSALEDSSFDSDVQNSVMSDYALSDGISTAPWFLIDSPVADSRYINSLIVSEKITVIGEYAFYGQTAIHTVKLFPDLKTIKANAFSDCNITDVYFRGTRAEWKKVTIESGNEPLLNANIHCEDDGQYIRGDLDGNDMVNDQDAIYLLFAVYFPDSYDLNQPVDFNNDGKVNDQDAIYLLFYIYFPDIYPLM
ncbi:MAG: leucine-rich repeat protein [Clostridia bacterium]|nr:leucine-rich repeat protein [Clostridia bacterium]